jgi:hypothetical protein
MKNVIKFAKYFSALCLVLGLQEHNGTIITFWGCLLGFFYWVENTTDGNKKIAFWILSRLGKVLVVLIFLFLWAMFREPQAMSSLFLP